MQKYFAIRFRAVDGPITSLVTKFGGQPVWYDQPEWPLSRHTGAQMMFIGQVLLEPIIFGEIKGRIAYLFITDDVSGVLATMDPFAGENAVIVQPGNTVVPVMRASTGPVLAARGRPSRRAEAPECGVETSL